LIPRKGLAIIRQEAMLLPDELGLGAAGHVFRAWPGQATNGYGGLSRIGQLRAEALGSKVNEVRALILPDGDLRFGCKTGQRVRDGTPKRFLRRVRRLPNDDSRRLAPTIPS
jgi:hypothetical protein